MNCKRLGDFVDKNRLEDINKIFVLIWYIVIYALLALYQGLIPGHTLPTLGINYILFSNVSNFTNMITDSALYPYGALSFEGYGIILIGNMFNIFLKDSVTALTCTYLLLYSISYVSLLILGVKLMKNNFLTTILIIICFFSPFLNAQLGIPYVEYGARLIAFSVLLDYLIYNVITGKYDKIGKIKILGLVFGGRLLFVSIGWYTGVITASFSCLVFLLIYVINWAKSKNVFGVAKYLGYVVLPWFVSMLFVLLLTPSGVSDYVFSLEWTNGESVDITTLMLPQDSQMISLFIPSVSTLLEDGEKLYGDVTMWSNYLGYALIVGAIACIFIKDKNENTRNIKTALALTGGIGFVLALGPGLKILGTYYDNILDYTMPLENQIIFPWKFIYSIFPFTTMRAVYRWLLIAITTLYIMAFGGIKKIWEKSNGYRLIAIVLSLVAVLEFYPREGFKSIVEDRKNELTIMQTFKEDVIEPLRSLVDEGDVVAFCNYSGGVNGYLVAYMMEELGTVSYAGGGDKAIATAMQYKPNDIKELEGSGNPKQIVHYIEQAFEKGLCDVVLLPYFSTREASYTWDSTTNDIKSYKEIASEVELILGNRYKISNNEYFLLIQPKKTRTDNYYELTYDQSIVNLMNNDNSPLYGTYKSLCIDKGNSIEKELYIKDEQNYVYINMCLKGRDASVQLRCEEYDIIGNLVDCQIAEIDSSSEYQKYETELLLDDKTKRIVVSLLPESEIYLKNLVIRPYQETMDSMRQYNYICDGEDCLPIAGVMNHGVDDFSIIFDARLDSNQMGSFVNKMEDWCRNMSFDFLVKDDHLVFAFCEDGCTNYNLYIDKKLINLEDKNHYEIDFEKGKVTIKINDETYVEQQLDISQLFESNIDVKIGEGLVGEITNFQINY